mmetsp:Transcript_45471/g.33243  ORF Transcript_45471/g.33243 Transcript_45471/m.33243 type:complete len:138 (-) Transcript_45471:2076-2489(-)
MDQLAKRSLDICIFLYGNELEAVFLIYPDAEVLRFVHEDGSTCWEVMGNLSVLMYSIQLEQKAFCFQTFFIFFRYFSKTAVLSSDVSFKGSKNLLNFLFSLLERIREGVHWVALEVSRHTQSHFFYLVRMLSNGSML